MSKAIAPRKKPPNLSSVAWVQVLLDSFCVCVYVIGSPSCWVELTHEPFFKFQKDSHQIKGNNDSETGKYPPLGPG
jgi:hypothetical protein